MSDKTYRLVAAAAGVLIMMLAAGSLLLPLQHGIPGRLVVGWLLVGAGAIELTTSFVRRRHRKSVALAALATLLVGVRLAADPSANFVAVTNMVILWLVVRGAALLFSASRTRRPLGTWIALAAATDLLLALGLLAGLPVALLVYGLFGPTPEIVATFAWVFAASFIATGALLLAIAAIGEEKREPAS
ncbi:MAG TPA: DUF308 domain-containing protein [Sphingomicrobium sp.]|nr:DUF308 domain-containing protein [Sphingomicrobium sp.]